MWKVGDKIKFIKEGRIDSDVVHGLVLGKTYIIDEVGTGNNRRDTRKQKSCRITIGTGFKFWIEPNSFELYKKKKLKKETDFLDAFQENFKYE